MHEIVILFVLLWHCMLSKTNNLSGIEHTMEKTKLNIKGLKFGLDPHDSNTIPPEPNTEPEVVPNPKYVIFLDNNFTF